ncbi:MAG: SIS domain-containing protein [Planctomycetes bacterium]|nr:SIS domain-containing protein [Planctomycetota bacterium]
MKHAQKAVEIANDVTAVLERVKPEDMATLARVLWEAKSIFLLGAGRSGLVTRAFGTRLVQLGKVCHVVGESTTPAIGRGDLLLVCSRTGETKTVVVLAQTAAASGARVAVVTAQPSSALADLGHPLVHLPVSPDLSARQPLGSLFEQSLLLFLDAIAAGIAEKRPRALIQMRQRHANLE